MERVSFTFPSVEMLFIRKNEEDVMIFYVLSEISLVKKYRGQPIQFLHNQSKAIYDEKHGLLKMLVSKLLNCGF